MITIRLIDARRGLHQQCESLFGDKKIADQIYRYLCDGLEECDEVELVRCADCKWFQCNMSSDGYLPNGVDEFECRHWCGPCDPVDYCSYAERKEE